jgi:hypothetical protein
MALDGLIVAIVTLSAGVIFGAANSVFGWLKNNEPFDSRKFATTVITGIIAGVVLVFTNISGILQAQTNLDLLLQVVGLALAIFGVNELRTFISGMIANRAAEQTETL